MATPEEKALREALLALAREQSQIENDRLNLSMTLVETIKESLGITSQRSEFDRSLLSVNREITRSLLNQKEGLRTINDIEKQIVKNNDVAVKAQKLQESLTKSIGEELSKEFKHTEKILARRERIDQIIESEKAKLNAGQAIDQSKIERLKEMAQVADEQLANSLRQLSVSEQQLMVTKVNEKALQKANQERKTELAQAHLTNAAEKTKSFLLGGQASLFAAISAAVLKSSQLTNQFQQELGISYSNASAMREQLVNSAGASNDLFINSEKLQKSFFALKDTTGVFFDLSSQSAETFTNLTERIGLAGQEAGNLTMLMRLQGKETEANLENMYDTTGAMLQTSKTTASVKDILGDVAKSSKGLQASLAANPQALAKAAIAARELGATLADMEKTQGALLEFEQSIGAELEAELLTGKQLNLERARAAALNNDMATLAEELKKQNVDLASFGKMNVKQQEAMAKAMGMSRNEMSEMLLKQEMQNKTLDEIRSTMGEQAYEQAKQLSAQDKFNAAVEKIKDLFVGLMSIVTPIVDVLVMMLQPIAFIAKGLSMANEASGGLTNGLIGVGLTVLALTKKFGGLGDAVGKAFSKSKVGKFASGLKEKVMGSMGGTDKAGAAAGAAGSAGATPAPSDNGKALKEKMQNIAEGIKSFADTKVIGGALSMIVAAPGLVALGLASLPLKITEKINGEAIEAGMKGIANGVKAFANTKVLLGGLALIPISLALATMAVGAIGLGAIALLGAPAAAGMMALTAGLTALGSAAATGVPFLGVALIGAFGAALIPFGIALGMAAPAIEAVGTVIATVITSIADAVVTVMPALTQSLIDLSNNVNLGGLVGLALGLGGLSIAMAGLATSAMMLLPALPVLAAVAGIGAIATGGGGGGAGIGGGGGAGTAAANAGGITGEEVRTIVEETVTATINALVPEMVAALKEGQGKIKVTNDNFNNSKQSEGPSRNRNIVNNNFA